MYIIFIHILQFVCFLICLFCVSTQRITYFMSRRDLRLLIVTTLHYLILHFLKLIWSKCYKQWRKNEKYLPLSFDCIDINRIVITLFKNLFGTLKLETWNVSLNGYLTIISRNRFWWYILFKIIRTMLRCFKST